MVDNAGYRCVVVDDANRFIDEARTSPTMRQMITTYLDRLRSGTEMAEFAQELGADDHAIDFIRKLPDDVVDRVRAELIDCLDRDEPITSVLEFEETDEAFHVAEVRKHIVMRGRGGGAQAT